MTRKTNIKDKLKILETERKRNKYQKLKYISIAILLFFSTLMFIKALSNVLLSLPFYQSILTKQLVKVYFTYNLLPYSLSNQQNAVVNPIFQLIPNYSYLADIILIVSGLLMGLLFRNLNYALLFIFTFEAIGFLLGITNTTIFIVIGFITIGYFTYKYIIT
jgi:hypothetical protein